MSKAVLNSRIKEMKCNEKAIPQEYIACFNDYIEKVINTRVDEEIHYKDCQIEKWKNDYKNCHELEKLISKEHQYCLDNWRNCEKELNKQKEMWGKLKKWLNIYIERYEALKLETTKVTGVYMKGSIIDPNHILEKMQELEQGEKDE